MSLGGSENSRRMSWPSYVKVNGIIVLETNCINSVNSRLDTVVIILCVLP